MASVLLSSAEGWGRKQFSEQLTLSSHFSQMIAQLLGTMTSLEKTGATWLRSPKLSTLKIHSLWPRILTSRKLYSRSDMDTNWNVHGYVLLCVCFFYGIKTFSMYITEGKYVMVFPASGLSTSHFVNGVQSWVIFVLQGRVGNVCKNFHCHVGWGCWHQEGRGQRCCWISSNASSSPLWHSIIWPQMSRASIWENLGLTKYSEVKMIMKRTRMCCHM